MTVSELREALSALPDDLPVVTRDSDYGEEEVSDLIIEWTTGGISDESLERLEVRLKAYPLADTSTRRVVVLR